MKQPMPGRRLRAALTHLDAETGAFTIHAMTGELLIVELGPAHILALKKEIDIFVANYKVEIIKAS